nr:immunoglobulin heavy chain junction region [Macaca mulatta]
CAREVEGAHWMDKGGYFDKW